MATLSFEGLSQLGEDGRAVPRLAEKWEWEAGGTRLRVTLREGISFHDGTMLTAELAAKFLREAIAKPANQSLYPSFADVTSVTVAGARQLVIAVSQPSAFLPENLEIPLVIGGQIGTGPYRVQKNEPSEIALQRFEKYHSGQPQIKTVLVRPFQTLRTAWTSLLRGDIDMVSNVTPEAVEFISNDDIQVVSFVRHYQFVVAFNSRAPQFKSPAVRRALNVAIDRAAFIKNALQGRGLPSTGPLWPKHWAMDASIAPYGYDPGLARTLLQAAGANAAGNSNVPNARLRFVCILPANFSLHERVALEVQRQLYSAGVDMQFEVLPIDEFNSRVQQGLFEAMLMDVVSGPTLERGFQFWRSAREYKGGLNVFGYENAEANRLFGSLRTSSNEAATRSATSHLQQVLLEDPPALFLAWTERTRAVSKDFRIVQQAGRAIDPLYTIWQWTANDQRQLLASR